MLTFLFDSQQLYILLFDTRKNKYEEVNLMRKIQWSRKNQMLNRTEIRFIVADCDNERAKERVNQST